MLTMSADEIAKALGGKLMSGYWMVRCPAHDDHEPSLKIATGEGGKVLVHCHAGCDQESVIVALRVRGLWPASNSSISRLPRPAIAASRPSDATNTKTALDIWNRAEPAQGTRAESYLAARGIHMPIPITLRFHAALKHPAGGVWPAMIGLVTLGFDDTPVAIHRTFLAPDGNGKAHVEPNKMMLGPCRGGAVKLAPATDELFVGEGIETCLSVMAHDPRPAWAALSAPLLAKMRLPNQVRRITILADGDETGRTAAEEAAERWTSEGRTVHIAPAPPGEDYNDLHMTPDPADEVSNG